MKRLEANIKRLFYRVNVARAMLIFSAAFTIFLSTSLTGCTYYIPAKLEASRTSDTLSVAIGGRGAHRWDPRRDSLIIDCPDCEIGGRQLVEHFDDRSAAQYLIPSAEGVKLTLYSLGHRDTLDLPGTGTAEEHPTMRRLATRHYRPVTAPVESNAEQKHTVENTETVEKAPKKVATIKVTAPEGVAVYKDKTKREVLKILPQGSTIPLLAHEGDLYSVTVDGQEGFVEAEAVQVQE